MAELGLAEKVVLLHQALDAAGIAHAFGGALALAYYAEPRATIDIDVNLFVDPGRYREVLAVLEPLGIGRSPAEETVLADGQGRLWWGRNPVDLFFAYHGIHDAMRDRARMVPFGDDQLPIIAPEHLLTAKVIFNRRKDWLDIEQMLATVPAVDLAEAWRWLEELLPPDDERLEHLCQVERDLLGSG
jgi:hypothetical protein